MWTTFGPDVLVAAIGALMTVIIAYGTFLIQQRRTENHVINSLFWEINHRRALYEIEAPRAISGAAEIDDFKQANSSVLDIRAQIRRTREQIRPASVAQKPLSEMVRACNRYLEIGAYDPDNYHFHLTKLRVRLYELIQEIASNKGRVTALEPGASAL
jgi:hypothetical protein